jgi:hypothetical protein
MTHSDYSKNEYHGIIFNICQKDKSIFNELNIIGKKKFIFGLFTIYKVGVSQNDLNDVIRIIQKNMTDQILFKKQEFYAHFYRLNELIIVYKYKLFKVTTDKSTWEEAIEYGKSLKIKDEQLDFKPCKIDEETF